MGLQDAGASRRESSVNAAGAELVRAGLLGALMLALPVGFHALNLGVVFTPMLLPALMLGFVVRPRFVLATTLSVPLVSALLTGMPPLVPPVVAVVMVEAAALGLTASILYRGLGWGVWPSLGGAIVVGKAVMVVASGFLAFLFQMPPGLVGLAALVATMPGTVLMIVVVPAAVKLIEKR